MTAPRCLVRALMQIFVSARLRGLGKTAATAFRREPDLKARTGLDFSLLTGQIDAEIAVIEAGLDRLN